MNKRQRNIEKAKDLILEKAWQGGYKSQIIGILDKNVRWYLHKKDCFINGFIQEVDSNELYVTDGHGYTEIFTIEWI